MSSPTDNITLHIFDMTVHEGEVVVSGPGGAGLQVAGHGYDAARQFYSVKLAEILQPGIVQVTVSNDTVDLHLLSIEQRALYYHQLQLSIPFTGVLNDALAGFYRSSYTGPSGETRYIATTQFEATDARRAFPCFDEPAMKAVFQVGCTVFLETQSL